MEYYRVRWHIKTYFKVRKGRACKVEKYYLRTYERIVKYAGLFPIIAWRLYYLKHLSEVNPDQDFSFALVKKKE